MMWRYEVLTALAVGAAVVALAQIAEAGDTHGSGGNRNGNHSSSRSQSFQFQGGSSKYQSLFSQNKKSNHHDDNNDHHKHHNHHGNHHQGHHHQPYPVVVRYPYPVAVRVPVAPPILTTIPQGGANLVDGVNLRLVDVRMVDSGDAARTLGPRFRVVIGNRGKQAAGNFQVLAIAAKEAKFTEDLPSTMVEVEGIAPGQVAKVDVRLPIRAMTMIEGQPFNMLAVMVDSNKLIEETAEQDNSGLMERTKLEMLETR